jgi:hypothetical protein
MLGTIWAPPDHLLEFYNYQYLAGLFASLALGDLNKLLSVGVCIARCPPIESRQMSQRMRADPSWY